MKAVTSELLSVIFWLSCFLTKANDFTVHLEFILWKTTNIWSKSRSSSSSVCQGISAWRPTDISMPTVLCSSWLGTNSGFGASRWHVNTQRDLVWIWRRQTDLLWWIRVSGHRLWIVLITTLNQIKNLLVWLFYEVLMFVSLKPTLN